MRSAGPKKYWHDKQEGLGSSTTEANPSNDEQNQQNQLYLLMPLLL